MRLHQLFPHLAARNECATISVRGLSFDSRTTAAGDVFFAISGRKGNGADYISDAVRAGACAVVVPEDGMAHALPVDVPLIPVANVRLCLAQAAARFYPAQPATIVAVTGTSGKTSVAAFVRQILSLCGYQAAALGTTGVVAPSGHHYGSLTTPDPVSLHKICADLAQQGVTHLALEASSHGLDQYRLDGLHLTAAAFTNLSHDHLDYHRDMHDYLNAKLMLFRRLLKRGQMAVINADDVYSQQVIEACTQAGLVVFTTGVGGHDLHLHDCDMSDQSTRFCVRYQGQTFSADVPLVGEFMIANLLVAMGLCVAAGVAMTRIVAVLPGLVGAPGRLERVAMLRQAPIYVDYAHKPDALRKVLTTMRHLVRNKLIVVFGCGGDRDRSKRAEMGALAQDLADVVIVTDDNPRSEDPAAIRAAICAAAPAALNIADRAKAIAYALTLATAGDVIVIAGKGHEQGQIIGTRTLPFSDHDVVRALVREMAP